MVLFGLFAFPEITLIPNNAGSLLLGNIKTKKLIFACPTGFCLVIIHSDSGGRSSDWMKRIHTFTKVHNSGFLTS